MVTPRLKFVAFGKSDLPHVRRQFGVCEVKAVPGYPAFVALGDGRIVRKRLALDGSPRYELAPTAPHTKGYRQVHLYPLDGPRKTDVVHRVVYSAFYGPCSASQQVRHRDGDKTNNALTNLARGTQSENELDKANHGRAYIGERHHKATLTASQARRAKQLLTQGTPVPTVARMIGVRSSTIKDIAEGKTWRHLKV